MEALPVIDRGSVPLEEAHKLPLPHWRMLARVSEEELSKLDLAFMQFVTMQGLPGWERVNVWGCLRTIRQWTDRVRTFTAERLGQFRRNPSRYEDSEAYFRAVCMATVLQKEFGVRYDPAKIPHDAPFGVEDTTIHGIVFGNGGTCASLPVLYASIGRRLGYPIKIVSACVPGRCTHLFARWDGDGEWFNIEATGTGLATPLDEHYRTGIYEIPEEIEHTGGFLMSMTPRMELSGFLKERAYYLREAGHFPEAVQAAAWSAALHRTGLTEDVLRRSLNAWLAWVDERKPPGFPSLDIERPHGLRFFPASLPDVYEIQILGHMACWNMLRDPRNAAQWERMRRGEWTRKGRHHAIARYAPDGTSEITITFEPGD